MSCTDIHLLCLCDLFQEFLNDDTVILPYFTGRRGQHRRHPSQLINDDAPWCYLNMIITLHNIDVQLPFRRRHEHPLVDLQLHARATPPKGINRIQRQNRASVAETKRDALYRRPSQTTLSTYMQCVSSSLPPKVHRKAYAGSHQTLTTNATVPIIVSIPVRARMGERAYEGS